MTTFGVRCCYFGRILVIVVQQSFCKQFQTIRDVLVFSRHRLGASYCKCSCREYLPKVCVKSSSNSGIRGQIGLDLLQIGPACCSNQVVLVDEDWDGSIKRCIWNAINATMMTLDTNSHRFFFSLCFCIFDWLMPPEYYSCWLEIVLCEGISWRKKWALAPNIINQGPPGSSVFTWNSDSNTCSVFRWCCLHLCLLLAVRLSIPF